MRTLVPRSRLRVAAALVAATLVFGATPPTSAAVRVVVDDTGDANAFVDITRMTVRNAPKRLEVSLRVPGLVREQLASVGLSVVPRKRPDRTFDVSMARDTADEPFTKELLVTDEADDGEFTVRPCAGLRLRLDVDERIRVVVPQRCFGKQAGAVKVHVEINSFEREQGFDTSPDTSFYTRFVARG